LCSILAIIFGIVGINRANKPSVQGRGKGLAISGLVLGCAGLIFGALWLAILLPAIGAARHTAFQIQSASTRISQMAVDSTYNELLFDPTNAGFFRR